MKIFISSQTKIRSIQHQEILLQPIPQYYRSRFIRYDIEKNRPFLSFSPRSVFVKDRPVRRCRTMSFLNRIKKKKRNQREERRVSLLLRRKKGKRGTQAYTTLTHMHRGRRLECDETSTGIVAKFRGRNFEQHRSSAINCTADERSFLEEIYELSLRIEFFLFKRMQRMISSIRHECSIANEQKFPSVNSLVERKTERERGKSEKRIDSHLSRIVAPFKWQIIISLWDELEIISAQASANRRKRLLSPKPLSSSPNEMQFIIQSFVQRYLIAFAPKISGYASNCYSCSHLNATLHSIVSVNSSIVSGSSFSRR